jgi:hypothetical protein
MFPIFFHENWRVCPTPVASAWRASAALFVMTLLMPFATAEASSNESVWAKRANGASHHVQSGFACPLTLSADDLSAMTLTSVIVGTDRQPPGAQVGCEYEGRNGEWLTVEITKMSENESVSDFARATRERIRARYPDAMGESNILNMKPQSPTGGRTYAIGYKHIRIADRRASLVAVGGEVGGWMITLIHFHYEKEPSMLIAIVNWRVIARSRTPR